MKRTIIISILMTLFFSTTSHGASQEYLNRKLNELNNEPYKFKVILDPTFDALHEYCELAIMDSFASYDDRMTREEYIDEKIDELKKKDHEMQDMAQQLAQDAYDSGYTSHADGIIEGANRSNDERVEVIRRLLKEYGECLDY